MKTDKALIFGSTARLKLLTCLKQKPKNVTELIKNCGLSQSAVSQHLSKLKLFKLVVCQKKGKEIYYKLTKKSLGILSEKLLVYLKNL
ncbi:MAG: metalloregulator ArsR/SmtB family transcription factor [Patescibacteria group bacterium]|nr:metalloregulator ArsR/SmtB family transcription factor [Patescibacteria group bacterium]